MAVRMLRGALCSSALLMALLVAGCERDRTLERTRRYATDGETTPPPADPAAQVGATQGELDLVQDRGRAAWALVDLPEAPPPDPNAAPDPQAAAEPATEERPSPFPAVEGLDRALAAVPLLIRQTPSDPVSGDQAQSFVSGRGDLVLHLANRPEASPNDSNAQTATATPDRLRMTLDVGDGQGPALRIEPVRTIGLAEEGAFAAWGPWPGVYGAWFVGNVVVDRRTVDQNHLMYVHAAPVAGSVSADGADASPTYAVHVVVLPVMIEGTVPQMQELSAVDRLAGAPPEAEEEGAAEAPEDATAQRALHLVLLDVHREGSQTAVLMTE